MNSIMPTGPALRVITINTWKCDGPYRERIAVLADQLAALDPDVVCCQEVFATADGGINTAQFLANRLGLADIFAPARPKRRELEGRSTASWSGLAILTRGHVVDVQERPLPADLADGERIVQFAAIWIGGQIVRIANVHLSHLSGADRLRQEQLETVLGDPWLAKPAAVRLLCGDFNAEPGSPPLRWLLDGCHDWRATDCWPTGSPAWARVTMSRHNGNVHSLTRERCLDYIVALAGRDDPEPRFVASSVVLDIPGKGGAFPSDHFGLATTVVIPQPKSRESGCTLPGGDPTIAPVAVGDDRGKVLAFRPRRSAFV